MLRAAFTCGTLIRRCGLGTEVEVEGFSAKGDILPTIVGRDGGQARVRSLGPGQWPQPIAPAAASLSGNAYDAQWVSVRGTVTEVVRAHDGVMLDLLFDGVLVRAAIPRWPQSWALPGYLRGQQIPGTEAFWLARPRPRTAPLPRGPSICLRRKWSSCHRQRWLACLSGLRKPSTGSSRLKCPAIHRWYGFMARRSS